MLTAYGASVHRHSERLADQRDAALLYMRLLLASIAATRPPDTYEHAREASGRVGPADRNLAAERARGCSAESSRLGRRRYRARATSCAAGPIVRAVRRGDLSPCADQLVWSGFATAPGIPATVGPIGRAGEGWIADRRSTYRPPLRGPHADLLCRTARRRDGQLRSAETRLKLQAALLLHRIALLHTNELVVEEMRIET